MKIKHISNIKSGQDGAIFGEFLFRFDAKGFGRVYDLSAIDYSSAEPRELCEIASFRLDKADIIAPHSNSVVFGNEYFEEGDEFPLLYSNIYNNFAKAENKLCGVSCVYRIQRKENEFFSTLVQLIEIGFADRRGLWLSDGEINDVRPYGNFVVDTESSKYYGFVMRDGEKKTRYFKFNLPKLSDGEIDAIFGVRKVVLSENDIEEYFDVPYHNFMQGAVCYKDKIYEVEGFGENQRSAIRIIDLKEKREELYFDFYEAGYPVEPEFIDFYKGSCIYCDAHGNVFELSFEG